MVHSIPATKAKNNFGELIKRIHTTGERVIVEKSGIPVVAIIPFSDLKSFGRNSRVAMPNGDHSQTGKPLHSN